MRNLSDPDFPRFVADPGTCTFTLVNSSADPGDLDRPAPFPAAGTPQPVLPPHEFWHCSPQSALWRCARCNALTTAPDGCNLGCPGAPSVTAPPDAPSVLDELRFHAAREHLDRDPDPPPPQSLAEARTHCRATLERLAAGECFLPDALAAVEGVAQAVRAECAKVARAANSMTGGGTAWHDKMCDLHAHGIADAIDALDLGGPPA